MRRADECYRGLVAGHPERFVGLDGARSPVEIAGEVREHVRALL